MPYMIEALSPEERADLPAKDFVFPKSRTWPIQDIEQAKTALTYASWPKNKDSASAVRKAVFKRYPELKGWATVGKSKYKAPWQKKKKGRKQESIGRFGELPGISDRLGALSELLGDSQEGVHHDPRGIGRTDGILSSRLGESASGRGAPAVLRTISTLKKQVEELGQDLARENHDDARMTLDRIEKTSLLSIRNFLMTK